MHDHLAVLLKAHLPLLSVGKVRNGYQLKPRKRRKLRLMYVSNRASIFDFLLGFEVEGKGAALNAFNVAGRLYRRKMLPHAHDDLVAYGAGIDKYLPVALRGNPELQRRATVVEELEMIPIEAVVRGYSAGGLAKAIGKKQKRYCGQRISRVREGARLGKPLFTPTTKAKGGHDLPRDYLSVRKQYGRELEDTALRDFNLFASYALLCGVIGADTKGEYAYKLLPNGVRVIVLADEYWTPDSSRFWDAEDYARLFPKELPDPMDKQELRNWGKRMGIHKLDPKDPLDVEKVKKMIAPRELVEHYMRQVERVFEMLWGDSIKSFQQTVMGIR